MIQSQLPLLDVQNLTVTRAHDVLLKTTSFQIFPNDKIALCGPNGSGKTTLMRSLVGLQKHQGRIKSNANLRIGYLPQIDNVDKHFPFTVHRFLKVYIQNPTQEKVATDWLQKLDLDFLKNKQIDELSRGEFQKILLIRSLLNDPQLLILDEPFSCLDQQSIQLITKGLLQKEGLAVLISIHDHDWIESQSFKKMSLEKESTPLHV